MYIVDTLSARCTKRAIIRVSKFIFTPNRYGAADDEINIIYLVIVKRQGDVGTGYASGLCEAVPDITPPVKVTNLRGYPGEGVVTGKNYYFRKLFTYYFC